MEYKKLMKTNKEDVENHLKKIAKIKSKIKFLSWRVWWIKKNTSSDMLKTFKVYDNIQSLDESGNNILISDLRNNKLPFNMMYDNFWVDRYFDITHSKTSKYSVMYNAETVLLEELVNNFSEHINEHIVDVWCWDWLKIFNMLEQGIKNEKIEWTIDYLWLDDSQDMLTFAKNKFYKEYYSKEQNSSAYVWSDNIRVDMKKVRPWFQKKRIQEIYWLKNKTPKTIFFLWWTIGNLSDKDQKWFLNDMKDLLQEWDKLIIWYFPLLKLPDLVSSEYKDLQKNYFEREKQNYEENNMYYQEKELDIKKFKELWIDIWHDDFDMDMEYDDINSIIYDIRKYKKDIMFWDEVVITEWTESRSIWTKIDNAFFANNGKNINKDFVESLYKTKENDEMINEFVKHLDVPSSDYYIEKKYDIDANVFEMYLIPIKKEWIEFSIKTWWEVKKIRKFPKDKLLLHKSKRFDDKEIKEIIESSWLQIIDSLWTKNNLYPDQDIFKLLVIKK